MSAQISAAKSAKKEKCLMCHCQLLGNGLPGYKGVVVFLNMTYQGQAVGFDSKGEQIMLCKPMEVNQAYPDTLAMLTRSIGQKPSQLLGESWVNPTVTEFGPVGPERSHYGIVLSFDLKRLADGMVLADCSSSDLKQNSIRQMFDLEYQALTA
jgi:hypothetical protein